MTPIATLLPIRAVPLRLERPMQVKRVAAAHKGAVRLELLGAVHGKVPAHVVIERVAPSALPLRELETVLQYVREGVADALGVDEDDPRVSWSYAQRRPAEGERRLVRVRVGREVRRYGVRILISQEGER